MCLALHDEEAGAGVDLHPSWWGMVVESCQHRNAKRCTKLGLGQSSAFPNLEFCAHTHPPAYLYTQLGFPFGNRLVLGEVSKQALLVDKGRRCSLVKLDMFFPFKCKKQFL